MASTSTAAICLVCKNNYTEENMVECTRCLKWFHYECVNVDDEIENDERWVCSMCEVELRVANDIVFNEISTQNRTPSVKSARSQQTQKSKSSLGSVSSLTRLKLHLIQEERELLRESRRILDEEESAQQMNNMEMENAVPPTNNQLSAMEQSGTKEVAEGYAFKNNAKTDFTQPAITYNHHNYRHSLNNNQFLTSSNIFQEQPGPANTYISNHLESISLLDHHEFNSYTQNHNNFHSTTPYQVTFPSSHTQFRNSNPFIEQISSQQFKNNANQNITSNNNQHSFSPIPNQRNDDVIKTQVLENRRNGKPDDLPFFYGNPSDWPLFYTNFERSTKVYGISNDENLVRLQKSLKGTAKQAVSSFLILPECVPEIISTLKILFGRPEQILNAHIEKVRNQPAPKSDKLESFVEFGLSVKNLCISLKVSGLQNYLNNPNLMQELIEKLPTQYKLIWAQHKRTLSDPSLIEFSNWVFSLSIDICQTIPSLSINDHKQTYRNFKTEKSNVHDSDLLKCRICNQNCTNASECSTFISSDIYKKLDIIQNLSLCKCCLKRHRLPCKRPIYCNKNQCPEKENHHPLLHEMLTNKNEEISNSKVSESFSMTQMTTKNSLFRIIPVKISNGINEIQTFAFLDEGSSVTLINENILQKLNLPGKTESLCLKWTGEQQRLESNSKKVQFSISGIFNGAKKFTHRSARTVGDLSLPAQTLDVQKLKIDYPYLSFLPVQSYKNVYPEILIGLDNWDLAVPLRVKEGDVGEPIGAKCRLGWTIFSFTNSDAEQKNNFYLNFHRCNCNEETISNEQLHESVKEFFSIDSLGIKNSLCLESKEIQRAYQIQENTLFQEEKQYKIGLLWKYDHVNLPDSKGMALRRLECIERKIKVNPELGVKMNDQLQDFIDKKYIRKLTKEELSKNYERIWYLPIFPALNPNKPNKFRIVWDAAAKVQGISLNSVLLKGDDQLASLLGVLLRFRERKIGFSADIKEMFLRVGIIEKDQHAQRFLWRNNDGNIDTYVMTVMTFGATCSPSNAQFVKNINAEKYKEKYPEAVECIQKNHYVDDLLYSMDSEKEGIKVAKQVVWIHSQGNFEIRNWCSNSEKLSNIMNNSKQNEKMEMNLNLNPEKINTEKVLGMWWDLKSDSFVFSLKNNKGNRDVLDGKRKPTKREILQILMSIYDPLGFLANFIIYLKIFLQELWRSKITWDEMISDDQNKKWTIWLKLLPKIEDVSIPRCYLKSISNWENLETQLHIFVDASEYASATVAYLRIKKFDTIECSLLGAKTHVAPIKPQTIPRLELDSAVMGARFAKNLRNHLSITVEKTVFWSDSKITLSWLRNEDPRKFPKYVSFRVAEIQENSLIENWRYVPTKLNVADEATKWSSQPNFENNSRWFNGPSFLYSNYHQWPNESCLDAKELTSEIISQHDVIENLLDFKRFRTFKILLNTLAYIFRFSQNIRMNIMDKRTNRNKSKTNKDKKGISEIYFTSEELFKAKIVILKLVQNEYYHEEIKELQKMKIPDLQTSVRKSSNLYKFSPYLDENNLLRVRGRIDAATCLSKDTKRPYILPKESPVTLLIIEEYHRKYLHRNHETVVNEIRQKYFIPKLRRILHKIRSKCSFCKIKNALPQSPEMSPLPECRLATFCPPFTHTGVDYFGPINVTVGRRTEKRWGALFTCLTIRGVHLEIVPKLDTDSCIICFANFMNRRGRPKHIYCDRGTNFIGTERVLREEYKKLDLKLIAHAFVDPELKFHFNSPLSPHMAGAWERLVKSTKIALYDALPSRTPTDFLLQSCLITAENIINSRPLTYLPLESEQSEALTPNHWLLGSSSGDKPFFSDISDDSKVLKRNYLYREQFANKCWQRFVAEYLPTLLLRPKWHKQISQIKEGDIVIICDKDLPRNNWPKGRVIEVKKSKDGQVRKATVQTSNGIFERPAVKLAVLSLEEKT